MIQTICHLIASREHGGLEKHVADLSRWQAHNTGAHIAVIAHPRYLQTLDERIQFIPLNTDRSRHHPNLVWRLASLIRKGGYQIVHGHGSKSAQLMAAVQPYTETRQVITRHNVRHPRDKLASAFDARIAISHTTVANSKLEWNIIPNGVELSAPAANTVLPGLPSSDGPTLLVASRLIKARCVDQLITAMPLLPGTRLMVLGDGPEKEALQQLVSRLQLDNRVAFFAGNNTLADFMQAADLVIIPAAAESTPYTLLEALLHRTPVIASANGNAIDLLPPAYLLDDVEPIHIAEKIQATLRSTTLDTDFAPLFARAQQEFTLDSMARATWQVYTGLIA
ncbi:glycosyltransferase family 4 protein [Microbulbifer harenosus]|uniref:Glycosyltransferase family 4 protein n=1 Tax=Microbulbifer harenosus TaxID=2576840 RepID=A0ABY2UI49_9GAMM|nr:MULTISPECIES: glycosyltransferase family 4 protein [Microbulbifer]QIL88925.1 glycosyltransferase [Microbulbifer sp. SH-1]TLM77660.1 glycosyltransferase family 4 protein [Microbulbifer harenosus]